MPRSGRAVVAACALIAGLAIGRAEARKTQPVVPTVVFENDAWFPLTKKEMQAAAVDSALQELTGAALIELTTDENVLAGRLQSVVSLVERAETAKITITFIAIGVPSIVTTASISLHGKGHAGIYDALVKIGTEAGREMKTRLLARIPPDKADLALDQLLGKDWDNLGTAKLYNTAEALKRSKQYDEARELFKAVSQRKDLGSQQWKRLAVDELDYALPMFQANQELMAAAEQRRKADLDRIEKLYRLVIDKNTGNEARIAEAQHGLDAIEQLRSAMGMVDRSELKSRVRSLQTAMMSYFAEQGRAPTLEELKMMSPQLFQSADVLHFSCDPKTFAYSFEVVNKKTSAVAAVKGSLMGGLSQDVEFK